MRRRASVVTLVLFSLGGLLWLLAQSSLLDLEEVEVRGVRHTRPADIREAAALETGEPLLLVDRSDVADRVERLPWVEGASVSFSLPGTLVIEVAERVPVAWVHPRQDGATTEQVALVDGLGRVLDRRTEPPGRLVQIDLPLRVPAVGERLRGADDALRIAGTVPDALRHRVLAVGTGPTGWIVKVEGADVVRFGPPTDLAAKWVALEAVLERLGDRAVYSVDVRAPSVPAVRAEKTAPTTTPAPAAAAG